MYTTFMLAVAVLYGVMTGHWMLLWFLLAGIALAMLLRPGEEE